MALKGRVSNSNKKTAKITSTNSAGPQKVSVEVPAAGGAVTNVTTIASLTDTTVNTTAAGTFLQIQSAGGNFVGTAVIDSDTLAGASSISIHSGESLKAYIDTQDASGTITFSNKSIDLDSNTLSGTLAEFNTALQDDSFVSLTGSETLTNKTLTSPVITNITGAGITLDSSADINFDADGADIILKDGGTEFGRFTNNSGELQIKSGSSSTTNLTMSGANTTIAGNLTVQGTTTFTGGSISLGDAATDTVAFTGTITGSLTFEGSTDDSFETTLSPGNPSSDITISLPTTAGTLPVTAMVSGDATMATSGALTLATVNSNTGSFGSATAIPVITTNAKGLITAVSTSSITTSLTVGADSGSNDSVALASDTLTFTGGTNINTAVTDNTITVNLDASPSITSLVFEGATDDSFETTLAVADPDADRTITLPNATDTLVGKATTDTLTNKSIDLGNNTLTGSLAEFNSALQSESFVSLTGSETLTNKQLTSPVIAEIVGTGGIELDAVQDITLDAGGGDVVLKDDGTQYGSLTNTSGNLIVKSGSTTALTFTGANVTAAGNVTVAGDLTVQGTTTTVDSSSINVQNALVFEGATDDSFETTLTTVDPTADRTISLPNATDTLVGKATTDTLTNKTLTTPVIAEIDSNSSITLDAATDIILDAGEQDIILKDDGTEFGRFSNSSGQLVIKSSSSSTAALTMSGANVQVEGNLTVVGTSSTQGSTITLGNAATDTIALSGTITGSLVFEGSTDDSFETTLTPGNPSSDITLTLPSSASDTLVGLASTQTLTNKSIDLGNNTLTGSLAEFNSALQSDSFVSLTGSETLTNKTLTSPTLNSPTINSPTIVFEGATADSFETTLAVTDPTADRTITLPNSTGNLLTHGDFSGDATVSSSGAITLATVNSDTSATGSSTAIPVITANAKGLVTSISTASITTSLTVGADSGSNDTVALATDTLNFEGGNNITTTVSDNNIAVALDASPSITNLTVGGNVVFEGSTADSFETTLTVTDPTADRTITFPNKSGTVAMLSDITGGGGAGSFTTLATTGNVTLGDATSDTITFNGRVNSSIVPSANDTFDLGTSDLRWRTLFVSASTIDLGGATISSDNTGNIQISATGATLPEGSKVGTVAIAKAEESTGKAIRVVPFFKKGNLTTANVNFQFAASGNLNYVFRNFTKTDGSALTAQEEVIFLF